MKSTHYFHSFHRGKFSICFNIIHIVTYSKGGLGWGTFEIGIFGCISGVGVFVGQIFLTTIIMNRIGSVWCFRLGNLLAIPSAFLFPELSWIAKWDHPASSILLWIAASVLTLLRTFSLNLVFTSLLLLINNSVHRSSMGLLNGICQSFVAFSRMVGPVSSAFIFAFTLGNNLPFPFDLRLIFIIVGLSHLVVFFLSFLLRRHLETPKEDNTPSLPQTQH